MIKLLIATRNDAKVPEIVAELQGLPLEILSLNNIPQIPADFEVEEVGSTFEENAIQKAREYGKISGLLTLADDAGICVDALGGRPGIHSARYAPGTAEDRNKKLLKELESVPQEKRTARHVVVIALYNPKTDTVQTFKGEHEALVTHKPLGHNGHGYDPVMFSLELQKTFAEATLEEKDRVSHRGKVMRKVRAFLTCYASPGD